MRNDDNFMDGIYAILDDITEDNENDGIVYVGEEEDELYSSWGDEVIFIGDEEDDDIIEDLGEGYIPLSQPDVEEYEAMIIDEGYVLDEYELDVTDGCVVTEAVTDVEEICSIASAVEDESLFIDPDTVESIIHLPKKRDISDGIIIANDPDDDKIAKAIAREYLEERDSSVNLLPGDELDNDDDNSWINDPDIFGNNIDKILAEDEILTIEDEDYVEGSFEEWIQNNGSSI